MKSSTSTIHGFLDRDPSPILDDKIAVIGYNSAVRMTTYNHDANNRLLQVCNAFDVNDDEGVIATQSSPGGSQSPATAYTANNLNQYSSIPTSDFGHQTSDTYPQYDLDGNMTRHGEWTYTYDAANRLKTVSANGVTVLTNCYDHLDRRVRKITPEATHTFFMEMMSSYT